jgi:hypothetical protein
MRSGFNASRVGLLLGVVALGAVPAGCYYPGGPLMSADRYTYESTPWQPWTVTLTDTRTGEAVWSVDVPVDQQVVLSFSQGTGPNEYKPDEIVWELMPRGQRFGARNNRLPCPPSGARRLDATLRPTPEADMTGEPRPLHNRGGRVMQPIGERQPSVTTPAEPAPGTTTTTPPPATTTPPPPNGGRNGNGPAVLPPPTIPPQPQQPAPEPTPEPTPAPVEEPPASEPEPEPIDIPE